MVAGRETGAAPRVAIVATVRNERAGIESFLESLLGQTRAPEEIIVVDGASTDGTLEVLRRYEAAGRVRVISRPCNIAEGRNAGIAASDVELLAVTDAGCRVDPRWLERLVGAYLEHGEPEVVAGNFRFECHTPFEHAVVLGTFAPDRDSTDTARYFPSSRSVAFRKDAWARAGGYPEWLYAAEDTLFNIRLRQLGCRFVFASDAIVHWRPRETWRALARQRFNFARGNARIGFGLGGYRKNLVYHVAVLLPLLLAVLWPPLLLLGALAAIQHTRLHLWSQARSAAARSQLPGMHWRVLAVMEFVRLVSLGGFLRGRLDRLVDRRFVSRQEAWMGTRSVAQLDFIGR